MHNPAGRRNGFILSGHARQVCHGVLHLAIAHIRQQGHDGHILGSSLYNTRYGYRRASTTPMRMHIARIPAGRLYTRTRCLRRRTGNIGVAAEIVSSHLLHEHGTCNSLMPEDRYCYRSLWSLWRSG